MCQSSLPAILPSQCAVRFHFPVILDETCAVTEEVKVKMHGHENYGRGKSFRRMAVEITKKAQIQHSWSCKSFPGCLHVSMRCLSGSNLLHMLKHVSLGGSVCAASSHADIGVQICLVSQIEVKLLQDPTRDL